MSAPPPAPPRLPLNRNQPEPFARLEPFVSFAMAAVWLRFASLEQPYSRTHRGAKAATLSQSARTDAHFAYAASRGIGHPATQAEAGPTSTGEKEKISHAKANSGT